MDIPDVFAAFDLDYNDGLSKATIRAIKAHIKNSKYTKIRLSNATAGEKTRFAALVAKKTRSMVVVCCPVSFTLQRGKIRESDGAVRVSGSSWGCVGEAVGEFLGVGIGALLLFIVGGIVRFVAWFFGIRIMDAVIVLVLVIVVIVCWIIFRRCKKRRNRDED